jgi:hypothetical protein
MIQSLSPAQVKQVELNKLAAQKLLTQLANSLKANRVSSIQIVQPKATSLV